MTNLTQLTRWLWNWLTLINQNDAIKIVKHHSLLNGGGGIPGFLVDLDHVFIDAIKPSKMRTFMPSDKKYVVQHFTSKIVFDNITRGLSVKNFGNLINYLR